ncbi:MAG: PD-(D/E)XK nuclease family protein [Verrucomicrobiales bacterium]|nr:PD-(D/E)XK nuclease family protein [Verrucomicrobiales bacterium]
MPARRSPSSDEQPELPLFDRPDPEPAEGPAPASSSAASGPGRQRLFPGWERPILATVADHILATASGDRVLDLASLLIVVPTRHAGRRLRETLALKAAEREAAVFPPLVVTQEFFSDPERVPEGAPVADREATRLIWAALLLEIELGRFRCVFPVDPIERDLTWAMKTADELLDVRHLLTESGLTFATASDPLSDRDMEPLRWKELASLETLAIRRTQDLGLRDETLSQIDAVQSGGLPPEIEKILVAGTPALHPLAVAALERASGRIPVEVMVHAPESEAHRFDDWGRPLAKHWLEAEIHIPDAARSIRDAASPALQAELACELIGDLKNPAAFAAIGVPDPETIACLEQSAARRDWSTYDPAGQPVSNHGIYYLLDQTAALLATRSFESATRLFRCPDFTKALVAKLPAEDEEHRISATAFLVLIDDLRECCLPDQLEDAISGAKGKFSGHPALERGLRWVAGWMQRFRKEAFGTVLIDYLSEIFADRTFSPQETAHGAFSEVATAILEAEAAFEATREAFGQRLQPSDRFHLLLELIRQRHLYDEREPENIDLEGWLELLWEDAPHLVVTGMNDHVVPEAIIGHAFLPDSARQALGIPDNEARFARDAYLLTSLIETRRHSGGRLDLLFGRQSESGDPLRPSRLLFQCSDEELPERTLQFFGGEAPASQPLPWTLPWKLEPKALPDDAKIFQRLSVTQFSSYLACPFRFYLQHGLRMKEIDPEKSEMDARDFGNLIHKALDRFARDPEASVSPEENVIRASLENEVDAILFQRYGSQLSTPVLIQREAARRRLAWWAEIEAQERADGWRILEPETSISTGDPPFSLAGLPISGRIDRIEEHKDGRLRVFDFKTHAVYDAGKYRNKTVSEYHIAPIKRTEEAESFPEWSLVENEDGKAARWVDLQIPIYLIALAKRFPDREMVAGHIALGPTRAEIVLDLWKGLDAELLASAKSCAEGVIEAVRGRKFWPPAERLPWSDPFEELLFGEAGESVDSAALQDSPSATANPSHP